MNLAIGQAEKRVQKGRKKTKTETRSDVENP